MASPNEIMEYIKEWFWFSLIFNLIACPIIGYFVYKLVIFVENAWKTNNKKKKYIAICVILFIIFMFNSLTGFTVQRG